jgi:hypothetical protein
MTLADAPIAKEAFFVAHFLTVKDQARSREFYVRVLGAKVVLPEILAISRWQIPGSFSTWEAGRRRTSPR